MFGAEKVAQAVGLLPLAVEKVEERSTHPLGGFLLAQTNPLGEEHLLIADRTQRPVLREVAKVGCSGIRQVLLREQASVAIARCGIGGTDARLALCVHPLHSLDLFPSVRSNVVNRRKPSPRALDPQLSPLYLE